MKIHQGHKLLLLEDEEALKKENITIESTTKAFNEFIEKTINLKNKIENEITKIDKLFEKITNEVTKSYELKYEKLKKEETNLKEKLQNEVTKVKEKLELYLRESNNIIKINEKINKGIQNIEKEKENEKSMIKTLSYVSKINKNQKKMSTLFKELMRNLQISFLENESDIKYEEYYFNGIQIPNNIELKEIGTDSCKVTWAIDNIKINDIDNKQIQFIIEIRKENENDKFIQIYEGKNTEFLIENLSKNTNYEIRINCFCKNLIGKWSEIIKFKTKDVISEILERSKREKEFLGKIFEWSGYKRIELLYRGTRDGSESKIFHEKCDNQGPTICLFENDGGFIFGGYSSISWTNSGDGHSAPESFIFTLNNIYGTSPTKFPNSDTKNSVYHRPDNGPCFYDDIWTQKDFIKEDNYLSFPRGYKDVLGKGKSIFKKNTENNNSYVKIKEIEVFKLHK